MTVAMGIRHRASGEYEVVPVATNETFRRVWLPACERLGLTLVPLFDGGAFFRLPPNLIPGVVSEVNALREWASARPDGEPLAERCGEILAAFGRTDPESCDYDFG